MLSNEEIEKRVNAAVEIYHRGGEWKEYLEALDNKEVAIRTCIKIIKGERE